MTRRCRFPVARPRSRRVGLVLGRQLVGNPRLDVVDHGFADDGLAMGGSQMLYGAAHEAAGS